MNNLIKKLEELILKWENIPYEDCCGDTTRSCAKELKDILINSDETVISNFKIIGAATHIPCSTGHLP